MGMAANQARLMTLTARQSDLELRAQQISARKMRLAMEQQQVATAYSSALNGAFGTPAAPGVSYNRVLKDEDTIRTFISSNPNYYVKSGSNYTLVAADVSTALALVQNGSSVYESRTTKKVSSPTLSEADAERGLTKLFQNNWLNNSLANIDNIKDYFFNYALGRPVLENGVYYFELTGAQDPHEPIGSVPYVVGGRAATNTIEAANNDWFRNNVHATGSFTLNEVADAAGVDISGTSNVEYVTVYDVVPFDAYELVVDTTQPVAQPSQATVDLEAATREYDTAINTLAAQEKMFDLELTQINTEHAAIKTEYDSIQSLIKDNVEKSFNIFG